MRTLVFQSFRTERVPDWLERCMETVKDWAGARSFSYLRLGDEFFDPVTAAQRAKLTASILPLTDLARLLWARRLLSEGWERVIWIDADVLIFNPAALEIDEGFRHALCRELWMNTRPDGRIFTAWNVNNSVSLYREGSSLLDFHIDACSAIIAEATEPLGALALGTRLLTPLHRIARFPLIECVGTFSPDVIVDIASGGSRLAAAYRTLWGGPLAAANLCLSTLGKPESAVRGDPAVFDAAVERLLTSRGGTINDAVVA